MTLGRLVSSVVVMCGVCGLAGVASAQTALPLGKVQAGKTTSDKPSEYRVKAESAGVLTVAVKGEGDLVLAVLDGDGQPVPDGRSDRDLGGDSGTEMVSVTLGEAGDYRVRVIVQMGTTSSAYQIAASWMPFPPFARPADPDGRPGTARAIKVGESVEDALDASQGDLADWYVVKADSDGTLVVVTRPVGDGGDLVLEAFLDGEFGQPAARSDQDLQGNSASESVSLNVRAGQTVHVRVTGAFSSVQAQYRLSSSLMQ